MSTQYTTSPSPPPLVFSSSSLASSLVSLICHSVHQTSALVTDAPTAWPKDRLEKQSCKRPFTQPPMALSRKPTNMVAEHCFAEQVELHDEMAEYMQRVSEQPAELSVEEQKEQTKGPNSRLRTRRSTS